jgi:dipeptidyl aminopeptidase/acylaminoacyl peptidase
VEVSRDVKRAWIGGVAGLVVLALSVPAVRHLREQPPPPPPTLHLSFAPPAGAELGSGDDGLDAAISPDERSIVFVATAGGTSRLWRYTLATGRAEPLTGTEGAQLPAWKPTGNVVSFFAGGALSQIALGDGRVSRLADVASPGGAAWLADGALAFASGAAGPIRRMLNGRTSDATTLAPGDRGHVFPAAAAGGEFTYVALRDNGRRVVRLVTPAGERDLAETAAHAQLVGRTLLYVRDGALLSLSLGEDSGEPGRSTVVSPRIGVTPAGHGMFAASNLLLVFADARPRARVLAWHPASGAVASDARATADAAVPALSAPADFWQVRLSHDDRAAAVTVRDPLLRTLDVVVLPTGGVSDPVPVSRDISADTDPVWSPDGTRVLFRSLQSGQPRLFTREVGVRGADDVPLPGDQAGATATDWAAAPGARRGSGMVLIQATAAATGSDIWLLDTSSGAREPIAADGFNETDARWSPDRSWIAYVSDESGQPDIYAVPRPAGARVRVSSGGGSRPRWGRDGRSIFFVRGTHVMRAELRAGADGTRFGTPQPVADVPGLRDYDAAHRSDRLLLLVPAPAAADPVITAAVNWNAVAERD